MQLTHEQAHKLIQLNMDTVLTADESAALSSHLRGCMDCQRYTNEMNEVERLLSPVLKSQWNVRPIPLSIPALAGKSTKIHANILLTMRTAAISLVFVALFFSAWQFVISGPSISRQVSLSVAPAPTPSVQTAQFTSITSTTETCEMLLYTVQGNDTLAQIAERFSVLEDEIMAINELKTNVISTPMQLVIPSCNFTPTGTVHPATFTTTYTPILNPTTATPGG
jgi:LysM repeat protein